MLRHTTNQQTNKTDVHNAQRTTHNARRTTTSSPAERTTSQPPKSQIKQPNEAKRSQATNEANERTNERTKQKAKSQKQKPKANESTNQRTNEPTNQRTKERTNEPTNAGVNVQSHHAHTVTSCGTVSDRRRRPLTATHSLTSCTYICSVQFMYVNNAIRTPFTLPFFMFSLLRSYCMRIVQIKYCL